MNIEYQELLRNIDMYATYQIRLLNSKQMEIVLLRRLIPFPNTATECRSPVARGNGLAILIPSTRLPPDVPVTLGVFFG